MASKPKKKIVVVLMNRANYARSQTILRAIEAHPQLELQIVAGSAMLLERFGRAVEIVRADGFLVTDELYMNLEGHHLEMMAESVGIGLLKLPSIFARLKPDLVLTIADRYETLATAIAATYMNIPLAHTQGGELSGTIDESVRHAITKLAHLHFPATKASRMRLLQMGENPKTVFWTGCPSIDLVAGTNTTPEGLSKVAISGVGDVHLNQPYVLVMQHPVTTEYSQAYEQMLETLRALKIINLPALVLWPNPDAGSDYISKAIRMFREQEQPAFPVMYFKNIEPEDYATVLTNAKCAIGNSSSFIREGAYLGTPAVIVGTRQQQREHGANARFVPHENLAIAEAAIEQIKHGRYPSETIFGDGTAGQQIADILARENPPIQKTFYTNYTKN